MKLLVRAFTLSLSAACAASPTAAQETAGDVVAVRAPRFPLPPEADSAAVERFSFIVYGDTRGRRDGIDVQYEHSLIVESMLRTIAALRDGPDPVRFILQSGDAVVNGRNAAQWNRSFVELINRLTQEAGLPYFLAAGNHDVTSAGDLASPGRLEGLRNYLAAMAQLIPPDGASRRLDGYPTYAFGYGNTFVLALDSNIAEDSVQLTWATRQLEGLDRKRWTHVVAFFHHPAYSSGPHGGAIIERPTAAVRDHWMPLFRKHRVGLLFVGHEHLFEHWVERYRDGAGEWRRMHQVVTGGGGAPLYAFRGVPDLAAYRAASGPDSARISQVVRPGPMPGDNPYHYLVVHVDGAEVWLEVIAVDWGAGFQPYRSARTTLSEPAGR